MSREAGTFRKMKVPLIALKILLSVLLFAYVIAKVSPRNVWSTMRAADPGLLALAAALFLLSSLIGSWLWARLLRAQGVVIPPRPDMIDVVRCERPRTARAIAPQGTGARRLAFIL